MGTIRSVLLLLSAAGFACAETGVLVVSVKDPPGRALSGVRVGAEGGGTAGVTSAEGRARIRLNPQTRVGTEVTLQTGGEWVFISPWDARVRVPPFENESENYARLRLAARGNRAMLEYPEAIKAAAANITKEIRRPDEPREDPLQGVAKRFGLPAE